MIGRCLPYGEGITYWPLREIVRSLHDASLESTRGTPRSCALRSATATRPPVRRRPRARFADWWRSRPGGGPFVLGFEDIHWAEPALLELIEQVAGGFRDAPVLVLCLARPELLDAHPRFGGGKVNATTILVEPLDDTQADALVAELGGDTVAPATRRMITELAEGNPLFLEEIVAMVVDEGARLRRYRRPYRRSSLRASSCCRRTSARRSPLPRSPDASSRPTHSPRSWVRTHSKRCPHSSKKTWCGRRSAVRGRRRLPVPSHAHPRRRLRVVAEGAARRAARATCRLAETSATVETQREAEELVAWHLEQAHEAKREIGITDDELARRAFAALVRLGRAARGRSDAAAAESLLERALTLPLPVDHDRVEVRFDLVPVLLERGELRRAESVVELAAAEAAGLDDPVLRARAEVEQLYVDFPARPTRWVENAVSTARAALAVLEQSGDDAAIARTWLVIVTHDYVRGRSSELAESLGEALRYARKSGAGRHVPDLLVLAVRSLVFGPVNVDAALARCDEIRRDGGDEGVIHGVRAALHGMAGRFDAARSEYRAGHALLEELGRTRLLAVQRYYAAFVELLAGEPAAAERELRASARTLESIGDRGTLATIASLLAKALHAQHRDDEARTWAERSRTDTPAIDLISQVQWRTSLAQVSSADGVALAREAVAIAEATEATTLHADALLCLHDVLKAAGREDEAREAAAGAVALYRAKGHVVGVQVASGGT